MTRLLVVRSAARADILEQFTWLVEQDAASAADRFLDAVQIATARILDMPEIGSPKEFDNPRLRGLRSWPVPGFEAVRLYYIETDDTIRIVRVLHGMQDVEAVLELDEGA